MQKFYTEQELPAALKKFNGKIRIAPFAMNIHVLMLALADTDTDFRQLASVIHQYPVITARMIALANSAWVCSVTPITNVETACIRLGQSVVKAISIAIAVASAFNISRCPVFDTVRFWTTSMLVSEGAGLLATKLPNKASYALDIEQTVQTGGILHNMGLLWLAENFAMETAEALLLTMADPSLTVNQALMESIGIDYCGTGAWIGRQWGIPDELIVVMQHHRDAPYQENVSAEVLLVGAAASMASSLFQKTIEMPSNPALQSLGIDEVVQREVFTQLLNKFDSTKELSKVLFL